MSLMNLVTGVIAEKSLGNYVGFAVAKKLKLAELVVVVVVAA